MHLIKKIYSKNKFIVISAVLAIVCCETLCHIMNIRFYNMEWTTVGNTLLRLAVMFVCMFISYNGGRYISKYMLTFNLVAYTLFGVLSCRSGPFYLLTVDYAFYDFFSFLALIFFALYYTEKCADSVKCSLLYFVIGAIYVIGTYDEPEAFIALSMHLFLFVYLYGKLKSKAVRIVHIIFSCASLATLVFLSVANFVAYAEVRFIEGSTTMRNLYTLYETVKPFGTAEIMSELQRPYTDLNLAKVCGFFGYIIGGLILLIIATFIVAVCVKALKSKSEMKPMIFVAAAVFLVRYFASVFFNSGIMCGIDVSMPFLCDGSSGYFVIGTLLGLIFATDTDDYGEEDIEYYENDEEDEQWKAKIISLNDFTVSTN